MLMPRALAVAWAVPATHRAALGLGGDVLPRHNAQQQPPDMSAKPVCHQGGHVGAELVGEGFQHLQRQCGCLKPFWQLLRGWEGWWHDMEVRWATRPMSHAEAEDYSAAWNVTLAQGSMLAPQQGHAKLYRLMLSLWSVADGRSRRPHNFL